MRFFIAGANGFVGSHCCSILSSHDHEVHAGVRTGSDSYRLDSLSGAELHYSDKPLLEDVLNSVQPEVVVNTVCHYGRNGSGNPEVIEANLNYGIALAEACKKADVPLIINIGTALPKPTNAYSLSKHQLVEWFHNYASETLTIVNLRPDHIIGTGDDENKFVMWLLNRLKNLALAKTVDLTSGVQKRNFLDVRDLVRAIELLAKKYIGSGGFYDHDVCTGQNISMYDFVKLCQRALLARGYMIADESLNFGAIPYRKNDVMIPDCNASDIIALGWQPHYTLEDSIHAILDPE